MINNGKAFDMSFNGEDVHVPVGKFDCSIPALAYHIVDTATKWNMNVNGRDKPCHYIFFSVFICVHLWLIYFYSFLLFSCL